MTLRARLAQLAREWSASRSPAVQDCARQLRREIRAEQLPLEPADGKPATPDDIRRAHLTVLQANGRRA